MKLQIRKAEFLILNINVKLTYFKGTLSIAKSQYNIQVANIMKKYFFIFTHWGKQFFNLEFGRD